MASSSRRTRSHGDDDGETAFSQLMSVMIRQAEMQEAREERAERAREERRLEKEEQRAREERAREERRAEKLAERDAARGVFFPRPGNIDSFFKLRPPSFFGSEDALAAEDWLKEVGRFLEAARVSEEDKVPFATLLLKSDAHIWWEAEIPKYQALAITPSWDQFRAGFLKKFFPATQEAEMEKKFANLVQGSMTVDQYTSEFIRLSRFSPVTAASPAEMMKKFSRGLRQEIQDDFAVVDLTSFDAVLETARKLELVHSRRKARVQQALARRPFPQRTQQQPVPQPSRPSVPRPQPAVQRQQFQFQGASAQTRPAGVRHTCNYCGKTGHERKECWRANGLCLRCGAADHSVASCPLRTHTSSGQPRLQLAASGQPRALPAPPAAPTVQPRPPLPPQQTVYRQQQGRKSQKKAQVLQMLAELVRDDDEFEPEVLPEYQAEDVQYDGELHPAIIAGAETDGIVAGMTNISYSLALNTFF